MVTSGIVESNEGCYRRPLDIVVEGLCCTAAPQYGYGYNPPKHFNSIFDSNQGIFEPLKLRFDFLWWKVCEDGVELGDSEFLGVHNAGGPQTYKINKSKQKNLHSHFQPGFRLGVKATCPQASVDTSLVWTHFHSTGKATGRSVFNANASTTFVPAWERGVDLFPSLSKGSCCFNLDFLDLEFGRQYLTAPIFAFKPYIGLRGVRISQRYRVRSESFRTTLPSIGQSGSYVSDVSSSSDLLAVGPRLGIGLELDLCRGFSFFADAAGAFVYGRFDRHSKEYCRQYMSKDELNDFLDFYYKSSSGYCAESQTILDMLIGVKWDVCFCCFGKCYPFHFSASWEQHLFCNLNRFNFKTHGIDMRNGNYVSSAVKRGDVALHGLTIASEFEF